MDWIRPSYLIGWQLCCFLFYSVYDSFLAVSFRPMARSFLSLPSANRTSNIGKPFTVAKLHTKQYQSSRVACVTDPLDSLRLLSSLVVEKATKAALQTYVEGKIVSACLCPYSCLILLLELMIMWRIFCSDVAVSTSYGEYTCESSSERRWVWAEASRTCCGPCFMAAWSVSRRWSLSADRQGRKFEHGPCVVFSSDVYFDW